MGEKLTNTLSAVSPFLGGIGSLVQGVIGNVQQKRNQARQHRYNMELAKYNFSQNKAMWDLQNEYNTPANQMARFQDAGLNKNMIYGKGTPGNAQGTLPQYQQATVDQSRNPILDLNGIINQYQNYELGQAKIRSAKAEATAKEFQAEALAGMDAGELRGKLRADYQYAKRRNIGMLYTNELNRYKTDYQGQLAGYYPEMAEAEMIQRVNKALEQKYKAYWAEYGPLAGIAFGAVSTMLVKSGLGKTILKSAPKKLPKQQIRKNRKKVPNNTFTGYSAQQTLDNWK